MLENKNIIVGMTGSIAAYKTVDLVRQLKAKGASVRVVMTQAATQFITPLTLQAISEQTVLCDLFDLKSEATMGHIKLARWADIIVIAPASADFLAHLTYGFANNFLSALCLATTAPIFVAPAMNTQMWNAAITQENIDKLSHRGIRVCDPDSGELACGESGKGRMRSPDDIILQLEAVSIPPLLLDKKVLITAGPTREHIDPVRFITNRSSGKMGYALAQAACDAKAEVLLISGPVSIKAPNDSQVIQVETALQMHQTVFQYIHKYDIFISTAAVADYRMQQISAHKIKKSDDQLTLTLIKNPDIVAQVGALETPPFILGFAAETENLEQNAKNKRLNKKMDLIAANKVNQSEFGFD